MVLVIPTEAAVGPKPAERTLDDPPLRKRLETVRLLFPSNDLKQLVKASPNQPARKAFVGAVGE